MATAIRPLRKLQIGKETTQGTLVPATRLLVGEGRLEEEQDFYRSEYPIGIRGTMGGAGVVTRKGSLITWETELTAEEILWPLLTGIRGAVSGGAGPTEYTYTFTPELTSGVPTLDTATIEFLETDGVTNHYYGEAGYALTRSFTIEWAFNEVAKLSWEMFARARQSGTPTAALTAYTGREPLVSNLLGVSIDPDWATLGTTPITGIMRSATFECTTGLEPDYTMDARTDADMSKHQVNLLAATLELVMEFDATAAARFTEYRDNDLLFIRLANTGSTIDTNPKTVQIDGCYRFSAVPSFSEDNEQVLMTASLEAVYDPTGAKMLEFTVINALATV